MWVTYNCSLCYLWMSHKCTFNFSSTQVVSRYNNYIIYPTCNPIISILVSSTSVTSKIFTFKLRKISIYKSLMIPIYCSHLSRP